MLVDLMTPLDDRLQLPAEFHHVQEYLHQHDPDLRLRRSVERPWMFVLERRCRRAPAVNSGMQVLSDMHVQARDGYIHVSIVHREWLMHPWNIIIALREEGIDLWAAGASMDEIVDELEYEEHWHAETRRRRIADEHKGYYREAFDVLSRLGNGDGTEVTRFTNPGLSARADAPPASV